LPKVHYDEYPRNDLEQVLIVNHYNWTILTEMLLNCLVTLMQLTLSPDARFHYSLHISHSKLALRNRRSNDFHCRDALDLLLPQIVPVVIVLNISK